MTNYLQIISGRCWGLECWLIRARPDRLRVTWTVLFQVHEPDEDNILTLVHELFTMEECPVNTGDFSIFGAEKSAPPRSRCAAQIGPLFPTLIPAASSPSTVWNVPLLMRRQCVFSRATKSPPESPLEPQGGKIIRPRSRPFPQSECESRFRSGSRTPCHPRSSPSWLPSRWPPRRRSPMRRATPPRS